MEYYYDYDLTIDHPNNIYSLCPICHSKVHYANTKGKIEIIEALYKTRKSALLKYYNLSLAKLLTHYKLK